MVMANWSGTLFDTDFSRPFRRFADVLAFTSIHDLGLSSERPDVRLAIEERLRPLGSDPHLYSAYVRLLHDVWSVIAPEWHATGLPAVLYACTQWRRQLDAGTRVTDLLLEDHVIFQSGMRPLLEAALTQSKVVVTPCHFLGAGHILELSGLLSIGVRTTTLVSHGGDARRGGEVARVVRLLSKATRVTMIVVMLESPASVADLSAAVGVTETTVRSHLRILKAAGIVSVVPGVRPLRFRVLPAVIDRTLNDVSALLLQVHGRATRLHSEQLAAGAGL